MSCQICPGLNTAFTHFHRDCQDKDTQADLLKDFGMDYETYQAVFANLHTDSNVKKWVLDGGCSRYGSAFFLGVIKKIDNVPYSNFCHKLKFYHDCCDKDNKAFKMSDKAFHDRCMEKVKAKEIFFIPLECVTHVVALYFEKQGKNYSVKLVNTGDGLRFHLSRKIGSKIKSLPYVKFENIPTNKISKFFIREMNVNSMDEVYDKFMKITPLGKFDLKKLKDEDFITGQRGGSCFVKIVAALMRLDLGYCQYKSTIGKIKALSLIDYHEMSRHQDDDLFIFVLVTAVKKHDKRISKSKKRSNVKDLTTVLSAKESNDLLEVKKEMIVKVLFFIAKRIYQITASTLSDYFVYASG